MSDITSSIWTGFQMGHLIDQEKRLKEAAQLQQAVQQMQIQALQQKNLQEQQVMQLSQPSVNPNEIVPTRNPMVNPRAMELKTETSPYVRSVQSQYAKELHPAIEADMMMGRTVDETKYQKLAQRQQNEVKLSNAVEEAMASSVPGFIDKPEIRQQAYQLFGSDQKFSNAILQKAAQIAQSRVAPMFNVVQTDKGFVPFDVRKGTPAGEPMTTPSGQPMGKPTPAGEIAKGTALYTMGEAINRIEKNFKPQYVGPMGGRLGQFKEKWVEIPESQSTFYSDVNDIKDQLLRARSGAQINEQEYKRLVAFLPTSELPPKNFQSRMKRFKQEFNDIVTGREKELSGGGYKNAPGSNVPPFDVKLTPGGGSYDYEFVPGKGLIKAR